MDHWRNYASRWRFYGEMNEQREWTLVTGASSGIGRAVAIELSKRFNLVLNGRDEARLAETKSACDAKAEMCLYPFDLGNVDSLSESIATLMKDNGINISSFVHCAGVSRLLPVRGTKLCDLRDTFNTNVFAPFLIVQALASRRINGDALKCVVFISSNISNRGSKAFAAYGASKSGVDGLMRCLAVELAPNVRVNSVLPGAVRTRMTEGIFANQEVVERMKSKYPLGLGHASNIADAVAFLLSEKASWITGQQLTVDGGATIDITG